MRELRQADYNIDELAREVIEEIGDQLNGLGVEFDRDILERDLERLTERSNGARVFDVGQDYIDGAEEHWRTIGEQHGIEVYDDGEAGWTYVGTADELRDLIEDGNYEL